MVQPMSPRRHGDASGIRRVLQAFLAWSFSCSERCPRPPRRYRLLAVSRVEKNLDSSEAALEKHLFSGAVFMYDGNSKGEVRCRPACHSVKFSRGKPPTVSRPTQEDHAQRTGNARTHPGYRQVR